MSDFSENAKRLKGVFPVHIMSFVDDGEICDDVLLFSATDAGNGFVEIATDYGDERIYLRLRVEDILHASREFPLP